MSTRFLRTSLFALGVALAASACGSSGVDQATTTSSGSSAPQAEHSVALFSWWVAPGEAEALQALVDTYKKEYPGAHVTNSGLVPGEDAHVTLDKLIDSSPPDVFQDNASFMRGFMKNHPGAVKPLDDLFADPALKAAVLPDVLKEVTLDGHISSMPVTITRDNAFFYNKQIFAAQKLEPPKSLAELLAVSKKLKDAGITPVAIAGQGWVLRTVFMEMMEGAMGAEMFRDFITGVKPPTDPDVKAALMLAIDTFGTLLTTYVDVEQLKNDKFDWTNAADTVHDGKAAMYLLGDWVKGYFMQLGWSPGVDFGQTGAPGASDLFIYDIDVLGLAEHAPHPEDALGFLAAAASKEGQAAFSRFKGSTPMRTDVREGLDPLGQTTLDDLVNAKVRLLQVSKNEWDDGCLQFSKDGDKQAFYQAFVTTPP